MSTAQKLTPSQRDIVSSASAPVRHDCEVEIVRIDAPLSGVSYAARYAERASRIKSAAPRCAVLTATSVYEAVGELVEEAGRDCWDAGNRRTIKRCIEKLSGPERRAVCLIFDRAGGLPENQQDVLKALCDAAAYRAGCRLRLIYLIQKVIVHQQIRNERGKLEWVQSRKFVTSGSLAPRSDKPDQRTGRYPLLKRIQSFVRMWDYSSDGMEEIFDIESDTEVAVQTKIA